jgi:hypothetical protein
MPYYRSFVSLRFDIVAIATPVQLIGGGGKKRGWAQGTKIYFHEKAWSSINHSVLSGWTLFQLLVIHFVIFTHLELSLVFPLVISPSTDIAANVRTFTLLYSTDPFM